MPTGLPDLSILDELEAQEEARNKENASKDAQSSESSESSEEEDFMSDAFLTHAKSIDDSRKEVDLPYSQRRRLELLKQEERSYNKPKSEIEKEAREAGMAKNLMEADSKAARMMKMMGYKAGEALGKNNGLDVPLVIEMKSDKTGLGHAVNVKRKAQEALDDYEKRHKTDNVDYRTRVRAEFEEKRIHGRLRASQRICEQLDLQNGIEENHLWIDLVQERKEREEKRRLEEKEQAEEAKQAAMEGRLTGFAKTDDESGISKWVVETEEEQISADKPKIPFDLSSYEEFATLEPMQQLKRLLGYLRETYNYCFWCGTRYESTSELDNLCPGEDEDDHD